MQKRDGHSLEPALIPLRAKVDVRLCGRLHRAALSRRSTMGTSVHPPLIPQHLQLPSSARAWWTNDGPDCQANGATLLPPAHSSSHRGGAHRQTDTDTPDRDEDGMRGRGTMGKKERSERGQRHAGKEGRVEKKKKKKSEV